MAAPFLGTNRPRRRELIEPSFGIERLPRIQNADAPLTWEQAARLAGWTIPTFAGRDVTPETAMRLSAVYAAVRLISGVMSSLPFPVLLLLADGDAKPAPNHAVHWLINEEPCPGWSANLFWKYLVTSELLAGDQLAWIERDRNGNVLNLWPLNPRVTSVERDPDSGYRVYTTTDWRGQVQRYHEDDVLHIPGEGFDGLRGKSVIGWAARQSIGTGLAADEYAGRFFANGARFDYALTTEKRIDDKRAAEILNYWMGRHQGLDASHAPALLTEGVQFKELQMSPEDTQLLETRKFQVIDIARAFGVPPVLIGESEKASAWGTGIEQLVLGFVKFTVKPMLDKMAREVSRKLLTSKIYRRQDYIARHDLADLERGDTQALIALVRGLVGGAQGPGIATTNEVRRMVGLPRRSDGDALYATGTPASDPSKGKQDAPPPAE
jgi:HK97 family phage portal protein